MLPCSSRVFGCNTYVGFLEPEAAETEYVEYLPQLGDVAGVVDGDRQLDEAEMAFASVELGGTA